MTAKEKYAAYGTTIVPIHVPLARGETKEEYERRFVAWLSRQGLSFKKLQKGKQQHLERLYWFTFARRNMRGVERFEPMFPENDSDLASRMATDKGSMTDSDINAKIGTKCQSISAAGLNDEVVDSRVKCSCLRCLLLGMRALMQCVEGVQKRVREGCECNSPENMLHINLDESISPKRRKLSAEGIQSLVSLFVKQVPDKSEWSEPVRDASMQDLEDYALIHLVNGYELASRKAFDMDIEDATSIRPEAASRVIMHLWRKSRNELMQLVKEVQVSEKTECSRALHSECSSLSALMQEKQRYAAQIHRHLDRLLKDSIIPSFEREDILLLSQRLSQTEREIGVLQKQRRATFKALIRCDPGIRGFIQAQCTDKT